MARTIERLADLLVPDYASCAAVVLLDRDGAVQDSSARHDDASKDPLARQWVSAAAAPGGPLHAAIMSGRALTLDDQATATTPLLRSIGAHSTLCVPFGDRAGGVAALSDEPDAYGDAELAVVQAVGRFAAKVLLRDGGDVRSPRDQVLAEVQHDLTNPILAMQLSLDAMAAAGHSVGPDLRHLDNARRALAQIRELAGDMVDFTDAAVAPDPGARILVGAVVSEIVATLAPLALEKKIKLSAALHDAGALVCMRRQDLARVLSNLVGNAIRHTDQRGMVLVTTTRSSGSVVVRVQDNGTGIAAPDAARLFDPAWLATSPIRRGRGLGLSIVKRLIERAGGKLGVHSRPDQGSSFWFKLPIAT